MHLSGGAGKSDFGPNHAAYVPVSCRYGVCPDSNPVPATTPTDEFPGRRISPAGIFRIWFESLIVGVRSPAAWQPLDPCTYRRIHLRPG